MIFPISRTYRNRHALRHIHYSSPSPSTAATRAAAALHVSQPALSQQIRQLEETLGAQLFDRTGRVTRLTDAGDVYFRYARQALHDLAEGRRAIHDAGPEPRLAADRGHADFHELSRRAARRGVSRPLSDVSLSVREMSQERIEALLVDDEPMSASRSRMCRRRISKHKRWSKRSRSS